MCVQSSNVLKDLDLVGWEDLEWAGFLEFDKERVCSHSFIAFTLRLTYSGVVVSVKTTSQQVSWYDTKPPDIEAAVLELWGICCTSLLPLLPD